ncbi:Nuclear SAM-dependent mono-and asymmetric methyltransferase [Basidiobolus ranarum]|uniref:Nuclear SAM-dependent mono-and asymmetric methyltransferase n=1 Tax=Basidiobolus ranarum TaxID=34480 RepID=A0ABR2VY59_9FUNG
MGYFLLYESMLDTVLYARDRYLKEDGMIFPDKATMYVAGIEDGEYKEEKITFWDNVYGFSMSCIKDIALKEPLVDIVDPKAVATTACDFKTIDIKTVQKSDLTFKVPFSVTAKRDDYIHGFISWFDIEFGACHKPVEFSTGPHAKYTHWKQTVFYIKETIAIKTGETIHGEILCKPNDRNPRDLDIELDYKFDGAIGHIEESCKFQMS